MRYKYISDLKKRRRVFNNEGLRKVLTAIVKDFCVSKKVREVFFYENERTLARNSVYKVRNRCIFTNYSRGILVMFRAERRRCRENFLYGLVPGVRQSVW